MSASARPVDINVGKNIKQRRIEIGMSQQAIAEHLGVSFQQVQKYESGANRISASRIYDLCKVLGVEISLLFEGIEEEGAGGKAQSVRHFENEFMSGREALELIRAYASIEEESTRKAIRALVLSLSRAQ